MVEGDSEGTSGIGGAVAAVNSGMPADTANAKSAAPAEMPEILSTEHSRCVCRLHPQSPGPHSWHFCCQSNLVPALSSFA
jgi:hypothetical protein